MSASDLGAAAIRSAVEKSGLTVNDIDEVIMGTVISGGQGQAPARQAALKADFPNTIPAVTINKVCGSGLKAVMIAASAIKAGDATAIVAGGMENMSQAPHVTHGLRNGQKLGDVKMVDMMVKDGLWCAFEDCHMGMHAEHIAEKCDVTREDQDAFALNSQQKAAAAMAAGAFDEEIVAVTVKHRKGETIVEKDECVRGDSSAEGLAKLRTVFDREGTVTAGNASTLSDGAAAVVVVDEATVQKSDSALKAKILAYHTSGTEPRDLFIAPVAAVRGAVEKAGISLDDVDLFEINEAFASQMVACVKQLEIPDSKVNIHGGGISLGHPIGASGCRTLVTLMHALKKTGGKRGVTALCLGGGNAVAMAIELV